ncbi:SpoIIE family protein phosphatase [bacterium]|nr:SpoIIE family protein phosphatase [bacterium]
MEILIAEDDPVSRRVLEKTLIKWGYNVLVTEDGDQAWDALKDGSGPSFAVLDWMMPGIDGTEVCRRIRNLKQKSYTYVILLTAKDKQSDIIKGLEAGADDYVIKPFNSDELKSRLQVGKRIINLEENLASKITEIQLANDVLIDDLKAAALIQHNLLPDKLPNNSRLNIDFRFVPCDAVGGDMLDVFEICDNHIGISISDVAGHGVSAAMFAVTINRLLSPVAGHTSVVRSKKNNGAFNPVSPDEVLSMLNNQFHVKSQNAVYATMIYGMINTDTLEFTHVRAGHKPVILVRSNDASELESRGGLPIGISKDVEYFQTSFQLEKGDRLYFYTDGAIETDKFTDPRKDIENFLKFIQEISSLPLSESLDRINEMVISNAENRSPHDDVAILGIEIKE